MSKMSGRVKRCELKPEQDLDVDVDVGGYPVFSRRPSVFRHLHHRYETI
jgi:hypothetical protein